MSLVSRLCCDSLETHESLVTGDAPAAVIVGEKKRDHDVSIVIITDRFAAKIIKLNQRQLYLSQKGLVDFSFKITEGLKLVPISPEDGASGGYRAIDQYKKPITVIKPIDENVFCLHSRSKEEKKELRWQKWQRKSGCVREALAYQIAVKCKLQAVIPPTKLVILQSSEFNNLDSYLEKLCSVQEFIQMSTSVSDFVKKKLKEESRCCCLSYGRDRQLRSELRFDPNSLEGCFALTWVIGPVDAHDGNFLVRETNTRGALNTLMAIDFECGFPRYNERFVSGMFDTKQARLQKLSPEARELILSIDVKEIGNCVSLFLHEYKHSAEAAQAAVDRINLMKKIVVKFPEITLYQFNKIMVAMAEDIFGKTVDQLIDSMPNAASVVDQIDLV